MPCHALLLFRADMARHHYAADVVRAMPEARRASALRRDALRGCASGSVSARHARSAKRLQAARCVPRVKRACDVDCQFGLPMMLFAISPITPIAVA